MISNTKESIRYDCDSFDSSRNTVADDHNYQDTTVMINCNNNFEFPILSAEKNLEEFRVRCSIIPIKMHSARVFAIFHYYYYCN
jgi:hypothetical protein